MNFNESNIVEQMPTDSCSFAESVLKWSNLVAVAKF